MKNHISSLRNQFSKMIHFVRVDLWRMPLKAQPPLKAFLINQLRIVVLAVRGAMEDKVLLRAPTLTLYSLLSIVPAAAIAFGIAQGFGLETYLERQLRLALVGRDEVFYWLMELTESFLLEIHGSTLAAAGLIFLIYTVTMLLVNIEKSFNEIWQVSKGRPWSRKFSDYLAMIFIAPLLVTLSGVATVYLNTQIQELSGSIFSPLLLTLARIVPYLLIWIVFTLLYIIMPNTGVQFSSALIAGIIAGTAFQLVQYVYIAFQLGAATYGTMYGSLAALPLLLIWMQASWIIVLFGAELSYARHNVDNYEFETEARTISPFNKKILSLYVLQLLVQNFQKGKDPLNPGQIASELQMPNSLVRNILNELEAVKLIAEVKMDQSKRTTYQPAIDINSISIKMVLERLDYKGLDMLMAKNSASLEALQKALHDFYSLIEHSDQNKLLKDLP